MKETTKPCNSPHTITTARRTDNIPLICTGAGPIHPVHSQPMSLATEAMPETRLHFCQFSAVFFRESCIRTNGEGVGDIRINGTLLQSTPSTDFPSFCLLYRYFFIITIFLMLILYHSFVMGEGLQASCSVWQRGAVCGST